MAIFPVLDTMDDLASEVDKALSWDGGRVRGLSLKADSLSAMELKSGEKNGRKKIQEILQSLGHDINLEGIESHAWYPAGYGPATYLIAAYLYKWGAEDIVDLGRISTRGSMLIKIIMNFVSPKATLYGGPAVWHKYYDFGDLVPIAYSEDESSIHFKVVGYDVHPINEYFHKGYFQGILQLVTGSDHVTIDVLKSVYRGDPHSEYKIHW